MTALVECLKLYPYSYNFVTFYTFIYKMKDKQFNRDIQSLSSGKLCSRVAVVSSLHAAPLRVLLSQIRRILYSVVKYNYIPCARGRESGHAKSIFLVGNIKNKSILLIPPTLSLSPRHAQFVSFWFLVFFSTFWKRVLYTTSGPFCVCISFKITKLKEVKKWQ